METKVGRTVNEVKKAHASSAVIVELATRLVRRWVAHFRREKDAAAQVATTVPGDQLPTQTEPPSAREILGARRAPPPPELEEEPRPSKSARLVTPVDASEAAEVPPRGLRPVPRSDPPQKRARAAEEGVQPAASVGAAPSEQPTVPQTGAADAPPQQTGAGAEAPAPARGDRLAPAMPAAALAATADPAATAAQAPEAAQLTEVHRSELSALNPMYADMLQKNPMILDFLLKHPSVMKNLNADNVKFLTRNIMRSFKNSKQQDEALSRRTESSSVRAITITNLPAEATESDIVSLLSKAGLGAADVSIARESRYRRSTGVAFAMLSSRQLARRAVADLTSATVHGQRIQVEHAGGTAEGRRAGRRIAWKDDDELWDVALFDKTESVVDFSEKVRTHTVPVPELAPPEEPAAVAAAASSFRQATAREHAEEARRMREALGSAAV